MSEIKIKKKDNGTIKKFDKIANYNKKLKDNLVSIKEKPNYNDNEVNTPTEYGGEKITETTELLARKGISTFNDYGKKSTKTTIENVQKISQKIRKKVQNKTIKKAQKSTKRAIKNTKRTIKRVKKTGKVAYKTAKNTTKATIKTTKKAVKVAKATVKATAHAIKLGVKATIAIIKAIILAIKGLVAAIVAGGWVAVLIIVIIVVIALICSSVYGIFFSSESEVGNRTMSSVITEINTEFTGRITEIQNNNEYDEYEINSNRAEWKDILSVYTVMISKGEEQTEVITLNNDKINKLKDIFWDMNEINYNIEEIEKNIEITDEDGKTKTEKIKVKILHINVTSKTVDEMIEEYNFNERQKLQLAELRKEQYDNIWNSVIYGTSNGSQDIVTVAKTQVGNVGGQPYWSWYGFSSRVEWCACFVSWCAEQCGYIEAGIIPKFASVNAEGVPWFQVCGLWQEGGYIPVGGDIIFFDWDNDNSADHVGIVEKCEENVVYTIEGNTSGDTCKENSYNVNSDVILGYGTPAY